MNAGILGLGLMGGSLARDLAERAWQVYGFDHARDTLQAARASGVLSGILGPDLQGLERMDVVVLAVPVQAAPRLLELARPRLQHAALITDLGSTKRTVCRHAQALDLGDRFVGSHPFAGDQRSGWEAARSGLYRGARVFLCPLPATTTTALECAQALWRGVAAHPEIISADAHDAQLAWTSHLPQLASTALALALEAANVPARQMGRGGRDVTRLAASDPDLWTGVVHENADALAPALALLEQCVADLRTQIESGNEADIRALFVRALRWSRVALPQP